MSLQLILETYKSGMYACAKGLALPRAIHTGEIALSGLRQHQSFLRTLSQLPKTVRPPPSYFHAVAIACHSIFFVLAGMFADFATQGRGCQLKPRMYANENMLGSYNVFATMTCVNSYSYVTVTYFCTNCFCAHLLRVRDAARLFCFLLVRSWSTYSKSTARYLSFRPMAQCVVHALKGLACRTRVTLGSAAVPVFLAHTEVTIF